MERPQSREERNRVRFRQMGQRIFDEHVAWMYLCLPLDSIWDEVPFALPEAITQEHSVERKRAWVDEQMYQTLTAAEDAWTVTGDDQAWHQALHGTAVWYEHCVKELNLVTVGDIDEFANNWENPDREQRYEFQSRFQSLLNAHPGSDAMRQSYGEGPEFYQRAHP